MADGEIAIGIDLGTSYSCVSILKDGQPQVIPNEWGERTHASVVSFLDDGTVLVGNNAKKNIITNAENTVYSAKRLIGRFYFSDEVKKAQAVMPYKIVEGGNNSVRLDVQGKQYAVPEISALVLKEMKAIAETALGRDGIAHINIPGICQSPDGKVLDLKQTLNQDQFNKMVMDLVQRTFKVCDEALQSARMTAADIDAVILVGGPTRLPIIRNSVKHYFQKEPMAGIDPDEVVAMGAAIQAGSLMDAKSEHYLLDVTPLTLRVGTVGGYTDKIIEKNTPIPIERSKSYTTNRDGQDKVKIRIYQGESNKASECELLGEFEFSGFRIAYRGEVRIEVTFEIDTNGIVHVTAADVETGQKTTTTIRLSSGLTEEMIRAAQAKTAATQLARGAAA